MSAGVMQTIGLHITVQVTNGPLNGTPLEIDISLPVTLDDAGRVIAVPTTMSPSFAAFLGAEHPILRALAGWSGEEEDDE